MEALPDFEKLPDADLELLINQLTKQETESSFERRTLQGRLDILRAEQTARTKHGSLRPLHVEQLALILSRGTPPGHRGHERLAF